MERDEVQWDEVGWEAGVRRQMKFTLSITGRLQPLLFVLFFFPPNPRPALSDHCMIDGGTFSVWGFSACLFFAA